MSNIENSYPDIPTRRFRETVSKIGFIVFGAGLYSRMIFELNENQNLLSNGAVISGLLVSFSPIICEIQDYRRWLNDNDKGDGEDGGDWPPDDDDDTPPIVPKGPNGIIADWTNEVEDYANSNTPVSV